MAEAILSQTALIDCQFIDGTRAMETLFNILGAERYSQHSICLTNDAVLLWIYTIADLAIFASYFVISTILLICRSKGIRPEPVSFTLFAGFILACGLTHLTKTITLFYGVYRLDVLVVVATAVISTFTALHTLSGARHARA